MAAVKPHACRMCTLEEWMIDGPHFGVHVCRRCDTAPATNPGSALRAGPPNTQATDENGWFAVPPGWNT